MGSLEFDKLIVMSSVDEQRKERQIDEVEVLKAVYLDDFRDLREEDVWKVSRVPCLPTTNMNNLISFQR